MPIAFASALALEMIRSYPRTSIDRKANGRRSAQS